MPLDPVIQSLFEQFPQLAIRPVWEKTPPEARALFKQFCQFADPKIVAIGKSEDIKMPGPAGRSVCGSTRRWRQAARRCRRFSISTVAASW